MIDLVNLDGTSKLIFSTWLMDYMYLYDHLDLFFILVVGHQCAIS